MVNLLKRMLQWFFSLSIPASSAIPTGSTTGAPRGWIDLVFRQSRNPEYKFPDNDIDKFHKRSRLAKWHDIVGIRLHMLTYFRYMSDEERYNRKDFWVKMHANAAGKYLGDCEDFALTSLYMLLNRGWDPAALRLACCFTEDEVYHAVLVISIGTADYVLDNRQSRPVPWSSLPYKWDMIEPMNRPDTAPYFWHKIEA